MKKTLSFVIASVLLLGVFVLANDDNQTGSNLSGDDDVKVTTSVKTGKVLSTDTIACMKTAVEKKEAGVKLAMDAYYASRQSAFATRTTAYLDAFVFTTKKEIKKAMDAASKVFSKTVHAAQKVKKGTIQAAWNSYRKDLKVCKGDIANQLMQERGTDDLND